MNVIAAARLRSGLGQGVLARRAGTSRPSLSAYEHGRKSPSLETAGRILAAAGFRLAIEPEITFTWHRVRPGRSIPVPSALPRLAPGDALATVVLPQHLEWSAAGRRLRLSDRQDRARVYEAVLREGGPGDVLALVDGVLLVDIWDELVLPRRLRDLWQPLVDAATAQPRDEGRSA